MSYGWYVWSIAALFYAYEFFQRIAPSAMESGIVGSFHINASTFGLLGAVYFYAYAIGQIPAGILFDRYGVRRVFLAATALVTVGSVIFSQAHSLFYLELARVFIGFGSAFGFIGCLKIASIYFSSENFPLVVGLTNTLGIIGALFAQQPFTQLVENYEWRYSMEIAAILGLVLFVIFLVSIWDVHKIKFKNSKNKNYRNNENEQFNFLALKSVLSHPLTWLIAMIAALRVVPVISFGELWALPFLRQGYGFSADDAATITSFLF
ncbi:MFS transporter, partial [Piscirickettsia litoralis]|uniref:MFS transporter n=1 Tax=Piscirickettsia litoralis TaxID=1891921 RepID=UPI001112DDD7